MKRVFVDTGGFFALAVADDANHDRARSLFEQAHSEGWRLVTTNAVVTETYALLLARARDGGRKRSSFWTRWQGVGFGSSAFAPRTRWGPWR